ncbi:N-acetyltransferase, partial [Cribrihabitans sp. XS_ASV171]
YGLDRLAAEGVRQVFVLGNPGYYGRFGFEAERQVTPPYPLPEAWGGAWQSLVLEGREPLPAGPLEVPGPWRNEAFWLP